MTYRSLGALTLERDVEKTTVTSKRDTSVTVKHRDVCRRPVGSSGSLTRAFASHQIFALGLVGVDGRDGDGVLGVGVQVLQNVGGVLPAQDGLVRVRAGVSVLTRTEPLRSCG